MARPATDRAPPPPDAIVIWEAQPRQSAFISCPADDVGFGGARGGGKSDAVMGDWLSHEDLYGQYAIGMAFRRERTQLVELIERCRQVLPLLGHKWHEQDKYFRGPNGGRLRFSYLENDSDADAYQGHSYCVAVGTKILMANGTLRAIELIWPGDYVATLEGPRRVSGNVRPYPAPCVRAVVRDSAGRDLGDQVHPVWHPVLTTAGLIWSQSPHAPQSDGQPQSAQSAVCRPRKESYRGECPEHQGWRAWSEDVQTAHTKSPQKHGDMQPLERLTVPVMLHAQSARSAGEKYRAGRTAPKRSRFLGKLRGWWLGSLAQYREILLGHWRLSGLILSGPDRAYHGPASALSDAQNDWNVARDFLAYCRSGHDLNDERALEASETCPNLPQQQGGVENKHLGWPWDVLGTTPSHSRFSSPRWEHPYTGEARHLSEEVTWGTMELTPCGFALVCDLSVEGANHYISESGLVNKNTRLYPEEMGTFPSETPINKLQATLRSGNGVPCQMKGTCNPGGPGHQWVRARYRLAEYPHGLEVFRYEFINPFTKNKIEKTRVFIPSKVSDNKFLGDDYVANLAQVGSENLVRAWLSGDWSVIEGAFFDGWSTERNVIKPFPIPKEWVRIRSGDWGYAKPFSIGWWAIVPEQIVVHGLTLPRGCMVRYREWYGCVKPNEGLRLDAEDVAAGIKEREAGEKIDRAVLDPSAFAQNGGPSIAERMYTSHHVGWHQADNTRVGVRGAMSGWDAMRGRIAGDGDGNPMLVTFSTCTDSIRTIPFMQHDGTRPEDIDTDAEDHAADEWRYACNSRPWTRGGTPAPPPKPRLIQNATLNDLWKANKSRESRM